MTVIFPFNVRLTKRRVLPFAALSLGALSCLITVNAWAATGEAKHNPSFAIIAHRGASGYLPEHTLEAATLAFAQHPDFIEQDVVITKDNVPIVLHDIHLDTVSNVQSLYPQRKRQDGRFYARDFTLDELRRLTLHERTDLKGKQVFAHRYTGRQANFKIATLAEHFELISELNRQFDQHIGVYPEVKSPAFHLDEGVDASRIVIETLNQYGFGGAHGNSYLQCFDFAEIKRIREELGYTGKLIMLIGENSWEESDTDYNWLRTAQGMQKVSMYADGIGPWIGHLFDKTALEKGDIAAASWVKFAHDQQLSIHPYTYRSDALPQGMDGAQLLNNLAEVIKASGVFTDHVPPVLLWRKKRSQQ